MLTSAPLLVQIMVSACEALLGQLAPRCKQGCLVLGGYGAAAIADAKRESADVVSDENNERVAELGELLVRSDPCQDGRDGGLVVVGENRDKEQLVEHECMAAHRVELDNLVGSGVNKEGMNTIEKDVDG